MYEFLFEHTQKKHRRETEFEMNMNLGRLDLRLSPVLM